MCVFFFSSRRRHTRSLRDWSSDVCSSDLGSPMCQAQTTDFERELQAGKTASGQSNYADAVKHFNKANELKQEKCSECYVRSEERRVGKEWRCGWVPVSEKKKSRKTISVMS